MNEVTIEKLGQFQEVACEAGYKGRFLQFFDMIYVNGWSLDDWYGQGETWFQLESDDIDWYYSNWFNL